MPCQIEAMSEFDVPVGAVAISPIVTPDLGASALTRGDGRIEQMFASVNRQLRPGLARVGGLP